MERSVILTLVVGGSILLLELIDLISKTIHRKLREKRRKTMPEENTYMVCFESTPYNHERRFVKATSAQEAVDIIAQENKAQGKTIDHIQVFKRELPFPANAEIQYYWKPSKEVTG